MGSSFHYFGVFINLYRYTNDLCVLITPFIKKKKTREHQANTVQGNLAVDFEISFNNYSRISNSVYTLFKTVQRGALDSIPVKSGSLVINGLSKVLKSEGLSFNHIYSLGIVSTD